MAGVRKGQQRGAYKKRVKVDDLSNLDNIESPALEQFRVGHSDELIVALRREARKLNLSSVESDLLSEYYAGNLDRHISPAG